MDAAHPRQPSPSELLDLVRHGTRTRTTSPREATEAAVTSRRPVWNMSTFMSRFVAFSHIVSPLNQLKTKQDLKYAQRLLFGTLDITPESRMHPSRHATDEELEKALKLVDSAMHPETRQVVPWLFRRSAFLIFNTPLFVGIAMTPQTLPWVIGWQVVNQTYNAISNYSNRSSTEEGAFRELATNFGLALSGATAAAVGTKRLVDGLRIAECGPVKRMGFAGPVLARFAPAFVASVSASVLNVVMVRRGELDEGVAVRPTPHAESDVLGKSKVAAEKGMVATMLSRTILPIGSLVFPPLVTDWLMRRSGVWSRAVFRLPVVTGVVVLTQLVSLPLSLAPWPWFMEMRVSDLEPVSLTILPRLSPYPLPICPFSYPTLAVSLLSLFLHVVPLVCPSPPEPLPTQHLASCMNPLSPSRKPLPIALPVSLSYTNPQPHVQATFGKPWRNDLETAVGPLSDLAVVPQLADLHSPPQFGLACRRLRASFASSASPGCPTVGLDSAFGGEVLHNISNLLSHSYRNSKKELLRLATKEMRLCTSTRDCDLPLTAMLHSSCPSLPGSSTPNKPTPCTCIPHVLVHGHNMSCHSSTSPHVKKYIVVPNIYTGTDTPTPFSSVLG